MLKFAWFAAASMFLFLVAQPIGSEGQVIVGVTLIAAMLGLWLTGRRGTTRTVVIMLALAVVCRYVYWRTTSTLPDPGDLVNFIPGALLYGVEMFSVLMLFISLFVVADPKDRPAVVVDDNDHDLPTVDVFIPTYNEDPELLATTVAAAVAMDYPAGHLTVYLLDDGGSDQKCNSEDPVAAHAAIERRRELTQLCEGLGAVYMTRARNVSAKAGNMNAALPRTHGDLVAVFDADHAPVRSFLKKTVGHFLEDPRLFLVQTPHFFLNPDPIEKNLSLFKSMPSENEMFYGVIQKGLDRWNAAFFCGSAALLRRTALEEAGGFDGVTITEDCETALTLHSRGWNSRYIDTPLIAGLQPETFSSFIGQRSRWCQGMMQILLLKNPVFRKGLSFAQRVCYLSSSLFWLFSLTRLTFVFAPLLHIFFSMEIYQASLQEFFAYTTVYMVANMMLQNYLFGRVRWPWMSELYEYVQSVYLIQAIAKVFLNPRKPTFNVTAKGVTIDRDQLSEIALPYFVIFGMLLTAAGVDALRWWNEPASRDMLAVVGLWNGLNLIIAGLSLGAVSERAERRRSQRLAVARKGVMELDGNAFQVLVEDVSSGGVRVRPLGARPRFNRAGSRTGTLAIRRNDPGGTIQTLNVAVRRNISDERGLSLGLEFVDLSLAQYRTIADLMYADSRPLEEFRDGRRTSMGIVRGSMRFLGWSMAYIMRGLSLAGRHGKAAPLRSELARSEPVRETMAAQPVVVRVPTEQNS
ncbi:Cellulose synthase catalytic subunit [UDP-forming] [Hartmannibacter diazotrophicus]|uniref:Cellulose synthase catalytic subunit [UDP-forming] n=1 Tax=Hartmannibacter diazotrophicus TaxID=1482074 RepID=A0A2C9DCN8_9HYPH|nr:UDP-forming cellulose synthase catalytic subunit [Hartmannibacter diazotrophicus]SON58084.1 Cellulose synthase catalytic subunit [UDP-forming] [Hartmannibacter diazotrophicus]